ncbi:transglutaminase TgpA family protein [Actinomadura scrupuli]|uniref:transglutaminase TgpA family protein n=1 Tax=Actinomadura scrupuli TaxID=559629 RepID=UPI003D984725
MKTRLTVTAAVATLLSSIGLYPLFIGWGWFWPGLGAVAVVTAAGALTRRFRLPAIFNLAGGLAALNLYLTVVYTAPEAFLWVVPTPSSLARLGSLMNDGWDTANKYTAPVPLNDGVALLATLGVGLVAATVDLLAVRLRRAAPAGLPLLAMYSVPAAVREESVSWIAFMLGATGFMALLVADAREQVSGWGRHVLSARWSEAVPGERPDSRAMAGAGRRVGMAAVALAVLVPMAVPGIHPKGMFGLSGTGDRASGSGTVRKPDPMVSLRRELQRPDDSIVLTYRTNDPGQPDYLRLWALDLFESGQWTYSSFNGTPRDRIRDRDLPPAPGLAGDTPVRTVRTDIKVDRRAEGFEFLPLPYAPVRVGIAGDWRVHPASLMVYSLRDVADGRSYTVTSKRAEPTAAQLQAAGEAPADIRGHYLAVSPEVQESILSLALRHTRGARNDYQRALKLQEWFTSPAFTYSLTAQPPDSTNDLLDFLTEHRVGYCQQFAAAMAVLARSLGIPARVAAGYTAGSRDENGTWVVRSRDAHAWPELYFEGVGWLRFEPTPGASGQAGQGTATTPAYAETATGETGAGQGGQATSAPTAPAVTGGGATPSAAAGHRLEEEETAGATPDQKKGPGVPVGWIGALVLILLILAVPMGVRLAARRRRWAQAVRPGARGRGRGPAGPGPLRQRRTWRAADPPADPAEAAHAAWAEMRADAIDHGLPWRSSDSPRAAARHLGELLELAGPASAALDRIARAEERARYAPVPAPADTLRADVAAVRTVIAESVDRRTRLRARLAPPTAMSALRGAGSRALEVFDRLVSRIGELIRR